jgi:protein O-GlcNAcase/histone acetyltransferase
VAFISGVIEGFYGRPWTMQQRLELFSWMRQWGMNTYMYGPKDDLKIRAVWRALYSHDELNDLQVLIKACHKNKIDFIYTIAPGLDIQYSSPEDSRFLKTKITQLLNQGVKHFCILFDDIPFAMHIKDQQHFDSFAKAQAHVSNQLFEHIRQSVHGLFLFCPTDYCARMSKPSVKTSQYLHELGRYLHTSIDIFWTGPEIVSQAISSSSIQELSRVLRRKPLIWDNFHANDYDIRRVYLGPLTGRSPKLKKQVRGILSNPNNEFEANFIPLRTLALYAEQKNYQVKIAYKQALHEWLPRFKTHGKEAITLADLEFLCDLLYTPFDIGQRAKRMLRDIRFCLSHPANRWGKRLTGLARDVNDCQRLFDKLTELDNRNLLYSLYSYMWEVRHELLYVLCYLEHIHKGTKVKFGKPNQLPNTYRTGIVAEIEKILPLDSKGKMYYRG